jgi:hypothetical protein
MCIFVKMIFAFDPKTLVLNEAIVISTFVYSKAAFSSVYSQFIHIVFLDHFYLLKYFGQFNSILKCMSVQR